MYAKAQFALFDRPARRPGAVLIRPGRATGCIAWGMAAFFVMAAVVLYLEQHNPLVFIFPAILLPVLWIAARGTYIRWDEHEFVYRSGVWKYALPFRDIAGYEFETLTMEKRLTRLEVGLIVFVFGGTGVTIRAGAFPKEALDRVAARLDQAVAENVAG